MADDFIRYERQIQLKGFGVSAQRRFAQSHIVIVGLGGLGSPAALYLAASGIGSLTLIDDDCVCASNLQRQIIHSTETIHQPKVLSAKQSILALNPHINVTTLAQRLNATNLSSYIATADIVLDCSDNFETRYALNTTCVSLKKILISGAATGFEGQLAVFDFTQNQSPCYNCLFPKQHNFKEKTDKSIFGPVAGIMGTLQASEALKYIAHLSSWQPGQLLLFNGLTSSTHFINFSKDKQCSVCFAS